MGVSSGKRVDGISLFVPKAVRQQEYDLCVCSGTAVHPLWGYHTAIAKRGNTSHRPEGYRLSSSRSGKEPDTSTMGYGYAAPSLSYIAERLGTSIIGWDLLN